MMRCALGVLGLVAGATVAEAGVIIDIDQVGSEVVATGSGAIDLTGLIHGGSISGGPDYVQPVSGAIQVGANGAPMDYYLGATGPSSFGLGSGSNSFGSGDVFGVLGFGGEIDLPLHYISETPLSGSSTFTSATFSSLGLNPGAYTYTWGAGADQSLTVQIGPVPEPSTIISAGVAGLVGLGYVRRRRAKVA